MPATFAQVQSSQIAKVGYDLAAVPDKDGKVWALSVEFTTGAVYEYAGVPLETAAKVVFGESAGKAFNALVKQGGFEYRQVKGAAK